MVVCVEGKEGAGWACRFCRVRLHRGDDPCTCSAFREKVTAYASLCVPCAEAVDVLTADTRVGKVHRRLIQDAEVRYTHSDD